MTGKLTGTMRIGAFSDDLLADAPLGAAVAALAERNRHHLEQMTDAEREDALSHWHDLAVAVLTAAGAALGGEDGDQRDPAGRSSCSRTRAVTRSRSTRASSRTGGSRRRGAGTPAQAAALELLEAMSGPERGRRPRNAPGASVTYRGMLLFGSKTRLVAPEDALPGRSPRSPFPTHFVIGHPAEAAVPRGHADRRRRHGLLLGRRARVLAARRRLHAPRSATPAATRRTPPTRRPAPAAPATPRPCSWSSTRR